MFRGRILHCNEAGERRLDAPGATEWIHVVSSNPMPPTSQGSFTHLLWQLLHLRGGRDVVISDFFSDSAALAEGSEVPVYYSKRNGLAERRKRFLSKIALQRFASRIPPQLVTDACDLASKINCKRFCIWDSETFPRHFRRKLPECKITFAQRHYEYAQGACAYNDCDLVVMQSEGQVRRAFDRHLQLTPKIAIAPNGVELDLFRPASTNEKKQIRARHGIDPDCNVVLFPSKLAPYKGTAYLKELIRSVAKRGDTKFLIAGDLHFTMPAHQQRALTQFLDSNESVIWRRRVSRKEMAEVYRCADIAIMPCVWREGFSMSALEAMASGLAIVATSLGFYPEVVTHGYDGVLMRPERLVHDIVACVQYLLDDKAMSRRLGENARFTIESRYPRERVLNSFLAILNEDFDALASVDAKYCDSRRVLENSASSSTKAGVGVLASKFETGGNESG
jgi:glycosyltransferase involved in cell wall biosynthesis